ncbi:MAG TPA: alpha/beta hydrolase family protein [Pyrinomonadaceae bacterium]|jgi:Predicted esterase
MRRFRLSLLILVLLGALAGFYYQSKQKVQTDTIQFQSKLVGKALPYHVVLPPGYALITNSRKHYPVIYLLHGWNGHFDSWLNNTTLRQIASSSQLIIITPEGNNGWYTDSATTQTDKYETYIIDELIPDVDSRYRTIRDRRGRGIAGYSMGGYGAIKFGLKHPELFKLAASISGAFDTPSRTDDQSIMEIFGESGSLVRSENDLERLSRSVSPEKIAGLPYLYFDCGLSDPWLGANNHFADVLSELKIPYEYRRLPGGHVWSYWDRQVQEVLSVATHVLSPPE